MIGKVLSAAVLLLLRTGATPVPAERLPFQDWATLGGDAVGVLVTANAHWAPPVGWTGALGEFPHSQTNALPNRYFVFFEGHSAQVPYVHSKGRGTNFMKSLRLRTAAGKEWTTGGVAMLTPTEGQASGLDREIHLVRVRVNGGRGAAPGLHFVVTDLKALDGTPGHPRLEPMLDEAQRRLEAWIAESKAFARDRVAREQAALNGRADPPPPPSSGAGLPMSGQGPPPGSGRWNEGVPRFEAGMLPSWREADGKFSVLLVRRWVVRQTRTVAYVAGGGPCPPGAPCMPPYWTTMSQSRSTGIEVGLAATFDRDGRLESEERLGPVTVDPEGLLRASAAAPPALAATGYASAVGVRSPDRLGARCTERITFSPGDEVCGSIRAKAPGKLPRSKVVVVWQVDGGPGESDRTIKFGEGPVTEDGFRLHFEDSLPATLLNQRAYGVGLLVLVPESTTLADGSPASGPVAVPLGSAARHAIIYRAAEMPAGPAPAWTAEFPLGFSCAASRKPSGGGFEVFSPTPCGAVELDEGPLRFPNWM